MCTDIGPLISLIQGTIKQIHTYGKNIQPA